MKTFKALVLFLLVLSLLGCASGAKMESMVYAESEEVRRSYDPALTNAVTLASLSGGKETNPMWSSQISDEEFSGAVKESLIAQNLHSDEGRFQLQVILLELIQPAFGFSFTVTTQVRYLLEDSSTESIVLDETIVGEFTATTSDAFAAIKRLRLANEGSVKKNIEGLFEKLAELRIEAESISMNE